MNWDRGFKRITMVLSIVGAIWAGFRIYQNTAPLLADKKSELAQEQKITYDDILSWVIPYRLSYVPPADSPWAELGAVPDPNENDWQIWHRMKLSELEESVRVEKIILLAGTPIAAFLGFCGVWVVYAATKWGAWPLYKWISVGFREDKQKDLKKTNE